MEPKGVWIGVPFRCCWHLKLSSNRWRNRWVLGTNQLVDVQYIKQVYCMMFQLTNTDISIQRLLLGTFSGSCASPNAAMNPENALAFLGPECTNPHVRKYAVFRLNRLRNEELELYLLQLVQALRYEIMIQLVIKIFTVLILWLRYLRYIYGTFTVHLRYIYLQIRRFW